MIQIAAGDDCHGVVHPLQWLGDPEDDNESSTEPEQQRNCRHRGDPGLGRRISVAGTAHCGIGTGVVQRNGALDDVHGVVKGTQTRGVEKADGFSGFAGRAKIGHLLLVLQVDGPFFLETLPQALFFRRGEQFLINGKILGQGRF